MKRADSKAPSRLVLVGGGHAHALALVALAKRPDVGRQVTLVSDRRVSPYSGMLPGCIAGDYTPRDLLIDLPALAEQAGATFVEARAVGLDPARRRLRLMDVSGADARELPFEILSLNVGIVPDWTGIAGAEHHAIPVKPISLFFARFDALRDRVLTNGGPRRLAVVGGGPAGIELAVAVAERWRSDLANHGLDADALRLTLISSGPVAPDLNPGARRRIRAALGKANIAIVEHERVCSVEPGRLTCASGRVLDADAAFVSTQARVPDWLGQAGLATAANGGVAVRDTLEVSGTPGIFAVGDCATMVDHPRPRAGVYAVRQGPVLAQNLMAALEGRPLQSHRPQSAALVLLRSGPGRAIAARGTWFSAEGALLWRLKDIIDRRFMAQVSRAGP